MIKRIVKMSFDPEKTSEFIEVFKNNWQHIKSFEGCQHVELLQCESELNIFFTYSLWKSESDLENYRKSELFDRVWKQTKKLFNDKPEAWSVKGVEF